MLGMMPRIIFDRLIIDTLQRCNTSQSRIIRRIAICFSKNHFHKENYIDLEEFCHEHRLHLSVEFACDKKNTSRDPEQPILLLADS